MKIGLLGLGVVGSGVMALLAERSDIQISRVLARRERPELGALQANSFEEILADPQIDTIVEVIGGMEPAHDYVLRALSAGKNVVSANKWMLSYNLETLLNASRASGARLLFSASVGGGIPYLHNLARLRCTDTIESVSGVVNGTTNLILDAMQTEDVDFADVLAQAQREGYAETDPSSDIDGLDARSKLCLMATVAFGKFVNPEDIQVEGIRRITSEDVAFFRKLDLICRLLVSAKRLENGKISAFVEPTLVAKTDAEASVCSNNNLIALYGRGMGRQAFFGQGAGKFPTAANVVLDLNDILLGVSPIRDTPISGHAEVDNSAERRYFVRTSARLGIPAKKLRGSAASNVYVTDPISIDRMHALAASLRLRDENLFFAGIRENN